MDADIRASPSAPPVEAFFHEAPIFTAPAPRRFGLPISSPLAAPLSRTPTSPPRSPTTTISLEEYEKEGREETRKELAALFDRLGKNPELTKHLPHVTQAMKENGKSSAQTARLKALRRGPSPSKTPYLLYLTLAIAVALLLGAANRFYSKPALQLPFTATGTSEQLLSSLTHCTLTYVLENAFKGSDFHPNCVNFAESLTRQTPLHLASQSNQLDNIAILLQHGANVNAIDRLGSRPLHRAKSAVAAAKLIEAGAVINALDSYNRTALFTCTSPEQVSILTKNLPSLFLHQDMTNSNALLFSLRSCNTPHNSDFQQHMQRAQALVMHMPLSIVGSIATMTDANGDSALKLMVDLASIPDVDRRLVASRLLADAILQLSRALAADPSQTNLASIVQNLEIPTKLVKRDALGTIAALLSASTHQQDEQVNTSEAPSSPSASSLSSSFKTLFDVTRCNAATGLYPISYTRSAKVLHMLLGNGASLSVKDSKGETPVHHILRGLSIQQPSMLQQLQLIEAVKSVVPDFADFIDHVPQEVKAAIERKFVIVNAEPMEWTVSTVMLGLELLSEPSHLSYQRLELNPEDEVNLPDELKSRKTAHLDVFVNNLPIDVPYKIEVSAKSESDNIDVQIFVGDSKISKSASNSWFGAMPYIRLPLIRNAGHSTSGSSDVHAAGGDASTMPTTAPHATPLTSSLSPRYSNQPPHFRVLVSCGNFLTSCSYILSIKTSSVASMDPQDLLPAATSFLDFQLQFFSLTRLAALLWLPVSSLPRFVPVWLRFIPFFVSLAGFYPAGPMFALYWAGYTTATHIAMRLMGW